jgi:hypothetical protein
MGRLRGSEIDEQFCTVSCVTIDDMVRIAQLPPPTVIKCDIEGAEFEALQGSASVLKEHRPLVLLATHGPSVHRQCCDFLSQAGYVVTDLNGGDPARSNELVARHISPPQTNVD